MSYPFPLLSSVRGKRASERERLQVTEKQRIERKDRLEGKRALDIEREYFITMAFIT